MSNEKYAAEERFWREELDRYVTWYAGGVREMYGIPAPRSQQRITRHAEVRMNALETWVNADRWRYCWHLFLEPSYFDGRVVVEIGPGPLGLAQNFIGAREIVGIEPLAEIYRNIGYPIDRQRLFYADCHAESLSLPDHSVDAAISVNAIDHVDDFEAAIAELERVVKPNGEIRIETHYHAETTTEPCVLNDDRVRAAFKRFDVQPISRRPSRDFYPPGTHPAGDQFVLWSNRPHLYNALEALP